MLLINPEWLLLLSEESILLRTALQILKYFLIIIAVIIILPYLTCPVYEYPEIRTFSGKNYYNPYSNIDTTLWLKVNLHAHSRVWWGLTYGYKSDPEVLKKKYGELGYDVTGISDYFKINPLSDIPVYEHGAGIFKNHLLVIGAEKVLFKDYLIGQIFHNKQNMICDLKSPGNLLAVTHPGMRNAYSGSDLKYLRGYDLIEAVNYNYAWSVNLWDTALSAGNPLFMVLNDDSHDITDPDDYGRVFMFINSVNETGKIIDALRNGKAIGVDLKHDKNDTPELLIRKTENTPKPVKCSVFNDTLKIRFDKVCDTVKLIGQNGVVIRRYENTAEVIYPVKPADTYIRTEVKQTNAANVYLNPVFKYNELNEYKVQPVINYTLTWLLRAGYIISISSIIFLIYKRKRFLKRK